MEHSTNYFYNSPNTHSVSMRNNQETVGKIPFWFHNVISGIEFLLAVQSLNMHCKKILVLSLCLEKQQSYWMDRNI